MSCAHFAAGFAENNILCLYKLREAVACLTNMRVSGQNLDRRSGPVSLTQVQVVEQIHRQAAVASLGLEVTTQPRAVASSLSRCRPLRTRDQIVLSGTFASAAADA